MKIEWKKVVKCLTSCIAVFAVVVVCLATPAKAAVYDIADFYQTAVVDGSDKTVFYEIDVPAYSIVTGGGSQFASGYGTISFTFPAAVTNVGIVNVYHFGAIIYGNSSSASDGLLDVSDIMNGAVVSLALDFSINMGTSTSIPMNANFDYTTFIMSYDKNMKRIETYTLETVNSSLAPEGAVFVENNCVYTLPDNTAYIGCATQIYFRAGFDLSTMSAEVAPQPVIISVDTNMIYEQSVTMDKIKEQLTGIGGKLDDTNEKLDSVISGTPEMNDSANQAQDRVDGLAGELNAAGDALGSLEKPEFNADEVVPSEQLAGASYLAYTGLISIFWENDTIMTMVSILGSVMLISFLLFAEKG